MTIKDIVKEAVDEALSKNQVKEKKFKYPFGKKVGKSQRKKNYVTIQTLNENGTCDFKKYQITDQVVMHNLIPRLASTGYVMHDRKGNPLIILPEWSVEPYSPQTAYTKSLSDGSNVNGYKLLMNKMELEKTDTKKKMGNLGKWIIGIALAAIIGYALISGTGGAV